MHQEAKIAALILACGHYSKAVRLERFPSAAAHFNKAGDLYAQQVANITRMAK